MEQSKTLEATELSFNFADIHIFDNWCRSILFKLVKQMPYGQLSVIENGQRVLHVGDMQSDLHAEIRIKNPVFYRKILLNGNIGAGESYVDGDWDSPNITNVIRVFARNHGWSDSLEKRFTWLTSFFNKIKHWKRRNSKQQARKNILAHYDLGNNLYESFLDRDMVYSSGIFPHAKASLDEAQRHKIHVLCEKLQLKPTDHLLEIGTGWGALAIYAATTYGCRVTTTTISDAQHAYAQKRIKELGLQKQITLLKKDYRELTGQYDKLVSVEMLEAVGKQYLPHFFTHCSQLLKDDGIMALQSITIADHYYEAYARNVDFIQKHVFPGGFLPSMDVLCQQVRQRTNLVVRHVEDIGLDYAQTLQLWWERFAANQSHLRQFGYDERFARLWQYYLNYCEGGFRERSISAVQLVASKPSFLEPVFSSQLDSHS